MKVMCELMSVTGVHTARDEIRLSGPAIEIILNLSADINKEFRACRLDQVFVVNIDINHGIQVITAEERDTGAQQSDTITLKHAPDPDAITITLPAQQQEEAA